MVVSSGLPMVLESSPLPLSRPVRSSSTVPCGWMNTSTPSCLGLRPERVKLRGRSARAPSTLPAEPDPAQTVSLDALLELLDGQIRVLQRHCREGHEAVGLGRADLGQGLVLDLDELRATSRSAVYQ